MIANLRDKESGTQNSISRLNTTESTASLSLRGKESAVSASFNLSSSEFDPHATGVQKIRNDNRIDFPSAISKDRIGIAVGASLLLAALIGSVMYWARRSRRGKILISPVRGNGQRSASVVFQTELEKVRF